MSNVPPKSTNPTLIGDRIRPTRRLVPVGESEMELPPIREAFLTPRSLDALFADLAQYTRNVRLTMSAKSTTPVALATAHEQLASGQITKLQIRYEWEQTSWIDTLERRGSGFRLVRIQHHVRL